MNKKIIGSILLILSILLAIRGGYLAYHTYQLSSEALSTLFASFLFFTGACLVLRHTFSFVTILFRIVCIIVIVAIFVSFLFPEPDISSLTILLIWAICLVHGFLYRPYNKQRTGLLYLAAAVLTIILYFLWIIFLPQKWNIPGLITGLFATGFLVLGVFYLFYLPKFSSSLEKPIFLYLVMTLTGFIGILLIVLNAINEHGLIFAPLGYVLLLLFAEWLLYRYRLMRLLIIWAFMLGGPVLFMGAVSFINDNVHLSMVNTFQLILFVLLLLFLVIITGICSPIGMMGIFRISSYSDFKKYLFPAKIKYNPQQKDLEKPKSTGFTLIEVLIVIAIVAIVSGGIIRLFTLTHLGVKHLELQNQAVFLAESELDRLRSKPLSIVTGQKSIGISDTLKKELKSLPEGTGKIRITDYRNTPLKEVLMEVQWQEGTQPYSVQLTTLMKEEKP